MKEKESNEAFAERIIKEIDIWQEGKEALLGGAVTDFLRLSGERSGQEGQKKARVALLIMQDETGKTRIECFADNRGKKPFMRYLGRIIGIVANRDGLYEAVVAVAKLASKMRNRKARDEARQ